MQKIPRLRRPPKRKPTKNDLEARQQDLARLEREWARLTREVRP